MSTQKPQISISMLARNSELFLEKAIRSVLNQTFNDWELIIIDDESSDGTSEIAKRFAAADERIHYFRNENNLGIPKSRNKALELSRGEFIAVLDSDDIWIDKDKLEKQLHFLKSNPTYGAVGTQAHLIDDAGKRIGRKNVASLNGSIRLRIPFKNQLLNSTTLIRKQAIVEAGGYDTSFLFSQDYELWLNLGRNWKLANLKEYSTEYRASSSSVSITKRIEQLEQNLRAMRKHKNHYPLLWLAYPLKVLFIKLLKLTRN